MHATDWGPRHAWTVTLAAGAVAQVALAVMLARGPLPGLNVDDALHALAGAATWHDVVRLELRSLYLDIYDQGRWPPLGGILQWPALAIFGPAEANHRLGILMWLVPCIAAWAAAARAAAREAYSAAWASVIIVLLALSSQTLLVASASVLCEVPGLALMLGAYVAAHTAWRERRAYWFWLGGLLLAGAWFTKWQYGIVATLALVVVFLRQRWSGGRTYGEIWLFAPSAVLLALWLASPYHLREMLMYLLWRPASTGKLAGHFMDLLWSAADACWVAKANLAVTLVGLALAVRLPGSPARTALGVHFIVAALGSGLKDLSLRTGLWIAIPAWALAAAGWGQLLAARLPQRLVRTALACTGALAVFVALQTALTVSANFRSWAALQDPLPRPAAQYIAAEIPLGARLLTVGCWREFISPWHIKLQMLSLNWHKRFAMRDMKIAEYPSFEWEPWRVWRPSVPALFKLRRQDVRPPRPQVAPDYVAVFYAPGDKHVEQALTDLTARLALVRWRDKRLPGGVTVTIFRCKGWRAGRSS